MALFDLFGIGQAPDYMSALMDEEQRRKLQQQATSDAMINFGLNALQQGGYSRVPVGLGQIIGSAGQAAMKGYDETMNQGTQNALMKMKFDEMKKQKDIADRRQAFLENVGKPNAVRQVAMQPTEQIPVPPMDGAVAPSFQTQMQPPTMVEEKYYDPEKELRDALGVGAVDYGDMYALAAKKKAGTEILTPEAAKLKNLPTNRGQVYQKNLDTGAIDLIQGTLAPEKPSFKVGDIQEYESGGMKVTREYQPDGTWKFIGRSQVKSGGEEAIDLLSPDAQKMMAQMYLKTSTVPPLGAGKNAALMKSNIINMAALMQSGKSPDEAANTIINNKQNIQAQNFALRSFGSSVEGRTTRSLNVTMDHLNTLEEASLALNNGDIRLANSIYNKIAKEVGEPAPTDFEAVKKVVAGEIVKASAGTAGALGDRQEIEKAINSSNSQEQLLSSIKRYKQLMAGQLHGLETQFTGATNRPASEFRTRFLHPDTAKLLPPLSSASPAPSNVQMKDSKGTYIWEYNQDRTQRRKKYV